jgi:hypothetical protein
LPETCPDEETARICRRGFTEIGSLEIEIRKIREERAAKRGLPRLARSGESDYRVTREKLFEYRRDGTFDKHAGP